MELRNVQRHASTQDANRLHENRYLSCSPHSDGSVTLSVELPKETAALVMKALEMAVPHLETKDVCEGEEANTWGGHPSRGASMRTCRVGFIPPEGRMNSTLHEAATDDENGKTKVTSRKQRLVHWADGGETTAENLVMLCSKHHRLLHEGGFEIKPDVGGQWHFRNASGLKTPANMA